MHIWNLEVWGFFKKNPRFIFTWLKLSLKSLLLIRVCNFHSLVSHCCLTCIFLHRHLPGYSDFWCFKRKKVMTQFFWILPLFCLFHVQVFPYTWGRGRGNVLLCLKECLKSRSGAFYFPSRMWDRDRLIVSVLKVFKSPALLAKVLMSFKKGRGSWQEELIPPNPKQNSRTAASPSSQHHTNCTVPVFHSCFNLPQLLRRAILSFPVGRWFAWTSSFSLLDSGNHHYNPMLVCFCPGSC